MEDTRNPWMVRMSDRLTSWIGSPSSIVVHTLLFAGIFGLYLLQVPFDQILLILTTAVSLEAIYLAIFIQMTVNRHTRSLQDVEEEIEELEEDLEDIGEDIEEISEDIDKIQEEEAAEELEEEKRERENRMSLDHIESTLQKLLADIEALKRGRDHS